MSAVEESNERAMKIYVAGPMTVGNRFSNVRKAIEIADELMKLGHDVFVPHLNDFFDLVRPQTEGRWIEHNMVWVDVCDAVYRIEGYSVGADAEVARALSQSKPVFTSLSEVAALQETDDAVRDAE